MVSEQERLFYPTFCHLTRLHDAAVMQRLTLRGSKVTLPKSGGWYVMSSTEFVNSWTTVYSCHARVYNLLCTFPKKNWNDRRTQIKITEKHTSKVFSCRGWDYFCHDQHVWSKTRDHTQITRYPIMMQYCFLGIIRALRIFNSSALYIINAVKQRHAGNPEEYELIHPYIFAEYQYNNQVKAKTSAYVIGCILFWLTFICSGVIIITSPQLSAVRICSIDQYNTFSIYT